VVKMKRLLLKFAKPLTLLYNESLHTGFVPLEWKKSHITPVHKGEASNVPNKYYRSIAVVSVVANILES